MSRHSLVRERFHTEFNRGSRAKDAAVSMASSGFSLAPFSVKSVSFVPLCYTRSPLSSGEQNKQAGKVAPTLCATDMARCGEESGTKRIERKKKKGKIEPWNGTSLGRHSMTAEEVGACIEVL